METVVEEFDICSDNTLVMLDNEGRDPRKLCHDYCLVLPAASLDHSSGLWRVFVVVGGELPCTHLTSDLVTGDNLEML